jgi:hypothetical protein
MKPNKDKFKAYKAKQGYILNIGYHIKAYKKKIADAICQQE